MNFLLMLLHLYFVWTFDFFFFFFGLRNWPLKLSVLAYWFLFPLQWAAPNVSLYNAVIQGMYLRGKIDSAKTLYTKMREHGLQPDGKTRAMMLQNLSKNSARHRRSWSLGYRGRHRQKMKWEKEITFPQKKKKEITYK